MIHPDRLTLDRLAVGEIEGADKASLDDHLADCAPCRERLWRIRQDLAMARRAIPDRAPVDAFRRREAHEKVRVAPWATAAVGWAAAACLLLVWAPWNAAGDAADDVPSVTRTRGAMAVTIQRERGDSVERIGQVAVCRSGDRLQFEPDLPEDGFFQIVNLQDDGGTQVYLPSTPAGRSAEELDFSIELDDYAGAERVFFVWTADPMKSTDLMERAAGSLALRPIEELDEIPLAPSHSAEQRSLLIYKDTAR